MRLRGRLALTTFGVLVLGLIGIYRSTDRWRQYQADHALSDAIKAEVASDGRARCEANAETFGGGDLQPLPPIAFFGPMLESRPQIYAYSAAFGTANPSAPPFPDDLKAALAAGRPQAAGTFHVPFGRGRQLAVRMFWREGPCAILLGRFGGFIIPAATQLFRGVLIILVVVGSAMLSAGPIVARIRRLTAAVKISANSMYAIGVPVGRSDEIGDLEREFNRAGQQIKAQVAIERRQAVQQAFARQLIDSQETDRKRIASDLHDGTHERAALISARFRISRLTWPRRFLAASGGIGAGQEQLPHRSGNVTQSLRRQMSEFTFDHIQGNRQQAV